MLSAFSNSLKIPDLRQRIFFTFAMVFLCRLLAAVPTPGVDPVALRNLINEIQNTPGGSFLGLYNLFSGGALERFAVGALGIMPYISASIIIQLMTAVVPMLEKLSREGEAGRQKITQYTRYLTVILCLVQGFFMAKVMENPESVLGIPGNIVLFPGIGFQVLTVITLTASTMLMMWLGEQITERGIGNGISLIITISIIAALPAAVMATREMFRPVDGIVQFTIFHLVGMLFMLFLVIAAVIAVTQAQRKIPVQYTTRVVGRKTYKGQSTFMPLRINYAGVMPIIFAQAILMFPPQLLELTNIPFLQRIGTSLGYGTNLHNLMYAVMILFFSYFWVATQFNPIQIADDLKRNGAYVPGIRPGRPTAEYLDRVMTRITLAGALFLTVIAVVPSIMWQQFRIPFIVANFFGGTSMLITVGVMLDTMRQIESHLLTRHYDGFLKKGKLRSRR